MQKVVYLRKVRVLIDTWWNVNVLPYTSASPDTSVLIDTWWNVNLSFNGINRIVNLVLIDTWWNVNQKHLQYIFKIIEF